MVESRSTAKKSFFSGVLLLSLSTLLVKVVGFVYKIPMLSLLGAVGMGYFHSAYEIYAMFCVIATAGLPVALSVLISSALARGDGRGVDKIFRSAMLVFLIMGIGGAGAMVLWAEQFCQMIRSEGAYDCILSIAPTVLFVCISSAYRGYFQGHQKMAQTAVSQLIEALGKLVFGLLFANFALRRGLNTPQVAAAAGWGLTLGTTVSTFYLMLEKLRFGRHKRKSEPIFAPREAVGTPHRVWRSLARLSIPMTLGASAVSLTKLIDMTMILRRLQVIGYTEAMANEAYGSYTALALSIYALLPSLVNSIALPLVPMLSAAIERGDGERQEQMIRASYHLTSMIAIPASLGIAAFARPILSLLFRGEEASVALAAPLLSMLGVSVFLSCMITATNSVLHAYRSVNRPILSMLAGAAVKILSAYLLIGIPTVGMLGAPISTLLCNLTVVIMNLLFASRLRQVERLAEVFGKPLAAAIPAIGVPFCGYWLLAFKWGERGVFTVIALGACVVLYLLFACLLGVIKREDLQAVRIGKKTSLPRRGMINKKEAL